MLHDELNDLFFFFKQKHKYSLKFETNGLVKKFKQPLTRCPVNAKLS